MPPRALEANGGCTTCRQTREKKKGTSGNGYMDFQINKIKGLVYYILVDAPISRSTGPAPISRCIMTDFLYDPVPGFHSATRP